MLRCIILKWLVLGSILLSIAVVYGQGDVTTNYTTGGLQIFRSSFVATECTLILPDKDNCTYRPRTTPQPHKKCSFPNAIIYPFCNFQVEILSEQLSGVYVLYASGAGGGIVENKYNIFLYTGIFPNNEVTVIENENVYLRMAGSFDDTMNCVVFYPNGTSENLVSGSSVSSPNYWGAEDECGVKVDGVTDQHAGKWKLEVTSDSAYVYTEFEVTVTLLKNIDTRPRPPIEWIFGETGTVSMSRSNSKYCEIWNPNKELVQRESACNYTKDIVTDADNGKWTIVFGMNGKLTEDKFIQEIKVIKGDFEVSVSESERFRGGLDLLCRIPLGPVTDCSFTRPDGEVLLPAEGVGNAYYSYFGDGFNDGDCGLTIHQLQEADKGWWECSVTVGATRRHGFLNVSATEDPDVGTEALTVVQNGSEVHLSCKAQHSLEYCWFRHPTGLHIPYSTQPIPLDGLPETFSPRLFQYDDTLQSGVCSLSVSRANITVDRGQWICHLGILGSTEEDHAVPIIVEVSDSEVISLEKELVLSSEPTILKCYSVPLGRPLQYCRFLRPDGKGFNVVPGGSNAVLGHYGYEAEGLEKGECGLRIVSGTAEDEGQWTCVAKLQGKKQEDQDFITLRRSVEPNQTVEDEGLSVGAIVGIAIGGIVVLLVIAGTTFFIVRCKQQA